MKKRIAVLFGGNSVEHDISIITGLQTINAIGEQYDIIPIYIKNGVMYFGDSLAFLDAYIDFRAYKHKKGYFRSGKLYRHILGLAFPYAKIDCALLCTHGGDGENGVLQGYLAYCGIPFTSPGVFQSALFMDKAHTKQMAQSMGINCLPWIAVYKNKFMENPEVVIGRILAEFAYPIIVKPCMLGSSIGINRTRDDKELMTALELAFMFGDKVIIEPALEDFREINIALFKGADGEIILSDLEEPLSSQDFLSFNDKYMGGSKGMADSKRQLPAKVSKTIAKTITNYSNLLYNTLDCQGVIRIDYLLKKGQVYLNEVNAIPGSLAFYLFCGKNISHSELIEKLISATIKINAEKECLIQKFNSSVLENLSGKGEDSTKLYPSSKCLTNKGNLM